MDVVRVRVWRCTRDGQVMIVYRQDIAVDKFAAGWDIEMGIIVRHANGDRTYEWGVLA